MRVFIWALVLLVCLASPVFSADTVSPPTEPAGELLLLSPSAILPLQPPLTIEGSLDGLESLLDSWQTDSLELLSELLGLRITVEALKNTLTQSERLAEGLAYSLASEQSKTQSLRRWLIASSIGGVAVSIVAFCLGAYSSP